MIRSYLRDLTNRHKPIERLNNDNNDNTNNTNSNDTDNNNNTDTNNKNNNDNNNNNNNNNNSNNDRREWKIMLRMCIKCISTKGFNETRTMHPKSRQVEVYMGSDTENVMDTLFNTLLIQF